MLLEVMGVVGGLGGARKGVGGTCGQRPGRTRPTLRLGALRRLRQGAASGALK